jgi:hypothetical protein
MLAPLRRRGVTFSIDGEQVRVGGGHWTPVYEPVFDDASDANPIVGGHGGVWGGARTPDEWTPWDGTPLGYSRFQHQQQQRSADASPFRSFGVERPAQHSVDGWAGVLQRRRVGAR